MLNEIIATYAITDDLLKAIGHEEDSRFNFKASNAEIEYPTQKRQFSQ